MKTKLIIVAALAFIMVSCEDYNYSGNSLGGTQSPIGEVDNTFSFSSPFWMSAATASVTELTDGVSKITYSVTVTDTKLLPLASYMPNSTVSGNVVTGSVKAKFTSEGIETVHGEDRLILIKYDAKVGDKYTLETDDYTITREVTEKSTEDDFYWGGMLIKTITVVETGHTAPGVTQTEYVFNHKFGIVSASMTLTDGTTKYIDIYSSETN
jgi:hypothetical protein